MSIWPRSGRKRSRYWQRADATVGHFGTKLRHIPAAEFLDEYQRTPLTDEIHDMANAYLKSARRITGATKDDLLNGIKSYVVARNILEREEGDGITMDCLGALGKTRISLPCIAWSKMLDRGIPAACEADLGAAVTHALVQLLFDRPGFHQLFFYGDSKRELLAYCKLQGIQPLVA